MQHGSNFIVLFMVKHVTLYSDSVFHKGHFKIVTLGTHLEGHVTFKMSSDVKINIVVYTVTVQNVMLLL